MNIPTSDREILRRLAERQAEIAALPVHQETIRGWKRLNSLGSGKPMVWINEIPWHEMDVNGELTLQSSHEFCSYPGTDAAPHALPVGTHAR